MDNSLRNTLLSRLETGIRAGAAAAVIVACLGAAYSAETAACRAASIAAFANHYVIDMPLGAHPQVALDPNRRHRTGFLSFPEKRKEVVSWVVAPFVRAIVDRNVFVFMGCANSLVGTAWAVLTVMVGPQRSRGPTDIALRGALALSISGLALLSYVVSGARIHPDYVCGGVTNTSYSLDLATSYLVFGLLASIVVFAALMGPAALAVAHAFARRGEYVNDAL